MGQLLSVTGFVALACTTFLAGPIINRFGERGGLIGMPLLVTGIIRVLTQRLRERIHDVAGSNARNDEEFAV